MQIFHHSLLITYHSLLITYHSSLKIPYTFGTITQYFSHCLWAPYLSLGTTFFFPVPKLTEPNKKKRKKETQKPEPSERRRKKKQELKTEPRKRKGKKMVNRCGCGSLHVCLITKVSLNYDWWKQKIGNKVMVLPNGLFTISPTIFELWVMETELWVMEIDDPNSLLLIVPIL